MSTENENSINKAIQACEATISSHRRLSLMLLMGIIFTLTGFFSYFIFAYQDSKVSYKEKLEKSYEAYQHVSQINDTLFSMLPNTLRVKGLHLTSKPNLESVKVESNSNFINYGIYLFGVVIISILTALYRLHIKEIAKAEHNLVGFYRIRIAGDNYTEGFATEVREALALGAFYSESDSTSIFDRKKMESPVPGHPGSDIVTLVINKLLENIEIKPKS